jgi:hypothetical protein
LRSYDPDPNFSRDLAEYVRRQAALIPKSTKADQRHLVFEVLAGGWMAAYNGNTAIALEATNAASAIAMADSFPANSDMARVLEAEIQLAKNNPARAIQVLESRSHKSDALYFVHALLLRAYERTGAHESALIEADWLASHRGLAYGEYNSLGMLQPANVLESNLAIFAARSISQELGRTANVAKVSPELPNDWVNLEGKQMVRRRLAIH